MSHVETGIISLLTNVKIFKGVTVVRGVFLYYCFIQNYIRNEKFRIGKFANLNIFYRVG